MDDFPLNNWVPCKLIKADGQLKCRWLNTYRERFTEPFFEETILKCKGLNSLHAGINSVSDITMMEEWAPGLNAIEPTAFIFHISRCGSTLVSQLLAKDDQHIVLSEVPFFDDILRLPYQDQDFDEAATSELLISALKYYGQKKSKKEKHLIIKSDSWHMFFYKQLRALYPSVPFILMYRSPYEVFRSLRKVPALQAVRGLIEPEIFGFKPDEFVDDHHLYLPAVLESYFKQYLEIIKTDTKSLLLNYNEGPMAMIKKIASFANMKLTEQDLLEMEERSHYHSKKPGEPFTEETSAPVPQYLNKAMELYHILDEKRMLIH
jgi:hypothetical protein